MGMGEREREGEREGEGRRGGREEGRGGERQITLRVNDAVETSQHVRYVHVMLSLQLPLAFPEAE